MFNFAELEEIAAMLEQLIALEPDHARELEHLRLDIGFRPSLLAHLQAYLEAAILLRGWTWEQLGDAVRLWSGEQDFLAVPGHDSPRSLTHTLLSVYLSALEAQA